MNLTSLVFGLCFITAGILFISGRLHGHLKAWKRMPWEEKARIRIEELCCNVGGMIALCGLIFLAAGLSAPFKDKYFVWAMVLWMVFSGIDVWYIEKKGKYYRT